MSKVGILLFLALSGCASAPGYRPPAVEVPAAFRETRDTIVETPVTGTAVSDTISWPELGDTTLTRLIKEAALTNLDIRAAEARVRGARSARTEAALDFVPTVTLGGGYTRQRLSSATFPIGVGTFPDQDIWDGGFDASWELDLFGRVRRNVQARGAFVAVNQEDLRDIQVSLTAELARAYFELRGAQEQLVVARRNAANQQRTLEVTRQRLDAGRGTAFDTERAQAQLSFTLASVPLLESQVRQAEYQIAVLVGRPPATVSEELDVVAGLPQLPAAVSVASPDSVVRRRPDVAAAERQLAVERALVGAAKADYLPRVTVGGSAGYSATSFGGLGDEGTFRYAVGPIISWPALNLGRVKARVDQSRAREAEAQAQYTQTVLRALQEVETALVRYRTSRSRVERIQEAASASERAADLARLRFSGGVADFLQVLDAERTQLEAQDQLAQRRTDAATAYAALYKALGGSWPSVSGAEVKQ
ncbi:MAG TPA: efflux transporter outer membrane subunit [Gemmatimonadales bacterium]|jgi:NodT family efflux transporter outer membrane factor (OMF) lipoprotein